MIKLKVLTAFAFLAATGMAFGDQLNGLANEYSSYPDFASWTYPNAANARPRDHNVADNASAQRRSGHDLAASTESADRLISPPTKSAGYVGQYTYLDSGAWNLGLDGPLPAYPYLDYGYWDGMEGVAVVAASPNLAPEYADWNAQRHAPVAAYQYLDYAVWGGLGTSATMQAEAATHALPSKAELASLENSPG